MNKKNVSVLLIEDTNADAEALSNVLSYSKSCIVTIHRASRLQEAITILDNQKDKGIIDLILLDLSLPDARDTKSIMIIANNYSHIPIIVVSDSADEQLIQRSLLSGAKKFLNKSECTGGMIEKCLEMTYIASKNSEVA
jgi:CheY-like chemotaxis protein